jgi:3-isopropylmalate dehydratase small subunit
MLAASRSTQGSHRHVGKHARRLEGARHAVRGKAVRAATGQVAPVRNKTPGSGREHAGNRVEKSGFACAIGADDADQLTRRE